MKVNTIWIQKFFSPLNFKEFIKVLEEQLFYLSKP